MDPSPAGARTCNSCGHVSEGDDRFCPKCGTTLPGLTPVEEAEIAQAPTVITHRSGETPAAGVSGSAGAAAVAPGASAAGGAGSAFGPGSTLPEAPDAPDALEEPLRAALSPSFLLVRKLGQGGMASVWLAREPALRRLVAVKVLAPQLALDPHARARFEREAQAVAGLSHPNVLGIYGLGELGDGTPYFVMQYVSGKSLAARLEEEGPLDPDEARRITGEVAGALAAAHAKGIIHRDIKPANILYDDEAGRALVSDFGIAAVRTTGTGDAAASTKLTGTGMMVGTPQYMSPEQMLAEPVTEKTDVYALGLLGYELAAGHGPFRATTPQELIAAHLRDVPRPLAELREEVDPEFAGLVAACLAKEAPKRPTAAEVAKRLAPGGGVTLEWPPPGLDVLHGALRRWSARLWMGTALLVVAAIGFLSKSLPRLSDQSGSSAGQVLGLVAAAGTVALLVAVDRIARGLTQGARSVHLGYCWLTVLETLADVRRDGGALIAGAREYTSIAPSVRSALRRGRVLREGLIFAGGLLPLLLLPLVLRAGTGRALSADAAPWLLVVPSLLLLLGAGALEYLERRAVADVRRALRERRRGSEDAARLVEPWYVSFEATRAGQGMGHGPRGGARSGRWGGLLVPAVALLVALAAIPAWLLGMLGPRMLMVIWPMRRPDRIIAESRALALAPDSTITPQNAGQALFLLIGRSESHRRMAQGLPELPAPAPLPPLPRGWPGTPLNPRAPWGDAPDTAQVLEQATRGFTPAQMAWLRTLDAHPVWAAFHTIATARAVDYFGARFRLPLPERADLSAIVRGENVYTWSDALFTLRHLAWYNTSRAALRLAERRPDEAERILRETVSAGLRVADGPDFGAASMIHEGRRALDQLARLTGRPVAGLGLTHASPPSALAGELSGAAVDAVARRPRAEALANARDTLLSRAARFQALAGLADLPCTNVREMLFGPDPDILDVIAEARHTLARFPSDSARIDAIEQVATGARAQWTPESLDLQFRDLPVYIDIARRMSHVAARILGAPRLARCFDQSAWGLAFLF